MYYYVDQSGQRKGPIPANQLTQNGVTGETLVWKAGMQTWTPAKNVAELNSYFSAPTPPPTPTSIPPTPPTPPTTSTPSTQPYKHENNMVPAILSTLFCCLPLGIYAIICASKSDSLFNSKQYEEAKTKAEEAKKYSVISIILGAVAYIIYFFIMLIAGCM